MRPADQIKIKYSVTDSDGCHLFSEEVYATAYKLPASFATK